MNDEQDRDGGRIRKYFGPPKAKTTTEEYASANLNNNAFANEDSTVKPSDKATGKGPSDIKSITPVPTTGKKKGEGKKIKVVDTPSPKKEAPQTPTVTAPSKEPPSSPPSAEPPKTETQTLARESENKDMLKEPPKDGEENEGKEFPNTLSVDPTVPNPNTLAREDPTATDKKKNPTEFDPYGGTGTDTASEQNDTQGKQQKEWKPSVTSQRMMDAGLAGLNMFGNVLGGANKAFSMLRGLASALTSRQLMSDPSLPARGFLNAMDQSGQIVEDGIRQVGEAYGIKDGVRSEDLVGTYKGAQYYREKQAMENAEKDYYGKVGMALSDVLGNNIDVNDPVAVQNALSKMDATQLSALNERLFGQNGSLKDMYDNLMVASNPNKVQMTQAKLLTELNKALRVQATSNAREAGLERSEANARARQLRQEERQIRMDQETDRAEAIKRMTSPDMMPQSNGDQMATVFNAILGDEVRNKRIRVRTWGDKTWVDPKDLNSTQLKALKRGMEAHPELLTDPRTGGVRALYDDVNARLGEIDQFKQDEAQAKIDAEIGQIKNSPLDMDMRGPEVRRDEYGIPETTGRRNQLRDSAREMKAKLVNEGGSADDIALCDNVILMCDMAEMRQGVFSDVQKMETSGIISPMDAEMIRSEARTAYRDLAGDLALSVAERDRMAQAGEDWQSTGRYEVTAHQLNLRGAKEYADSVQAEYKQGLKDARDEERRQRAEQKKIDDMARKARMDEREKQAAMFDERGIPTSPSNRPRDKCREVQRSTLSQIEIMLGEIPDTPENRYRRSALLIAKHEAELQLTRLDQEDHIQKMIQDARGHGMGDEAVAKAKELRDKYSDWEEFGKALNDIRENELGLKGDRAWRSTAARQKEAKAQAKQSAYMAHLNKIVELLGGIKSGVEETRDWQGTINNNLFFLKNEMANDFKEYMDSKFQGQAISRGKQRGEFQRWFENYFENKMMSEIDDSLKNAVKTVTDRMGEETGNLLWSIGDLESNLRDQIGGLGTTVSNKAKALTDAMEGYYKGSKQSRKDRMQKIVEAIGQYSEAVNDLRSKVNGMTTLGGAGTDKMMLGLTEEQSLKLDRTLNALESVSGNLQNFINNHGGDASQIDPDTLTSAVLAAYLKMDEAKETRGGMDMGSMGNIEQDANDEKLQTLKRILEIMEKHDRFFDEFNANREKKAYPVKLVDDAFNLAVPEQDQSEIVPEYLEGPARVSPPEPDGPEEGAVVPEEVQEAEEASQETGRTYDYGSDDHSYGGIRDPMQFAVDNFLEDNPGLAGYLREHPEEKTMMYQRDGNGEPIHQTIKGIVDNSTFWDAFGEDTPEIMMELAEDLLSQTDRRGIKDVETKWMQAMEDDPNLSQFDREIRTGAITNMKGKITSILEGALRASAEERRKVDPTVEPVDDAAQRKKAERNIRHFFSTMLSEAEFERKGGAKVPPEKRQAMLNDRRDQAIRTVLGEPTSEVEKKIADFVGENLYYNLSKPSWRDYDDVLTSLKSMENVPEAQRAYHRIMTREVLPRLFTMKNNGGAKERGEELQELTNLAVQFGRASEADRKYFDYDAIVDTMLKGPAALRYTNSAMNNAFKRAYTKAKGYKSLDDAINNEIKLAKESTDITDFNTKISGFMEDHGTKLKDLEDWMKENLSKTPTVGKIDAQLKKIIAAQNAANKIKKELADAKNMVKEEVSNEYGSKKIPDNIREEIRRIKSEQANGVDPQKVLDQFVGEGKYAKLASTLRDMRLEAQARSIAGDKNLKALGMTQKIADRLVEIASHSDDPDSALVQLKAKWIKENTPVQGTVTEETPKTETSESTVTPESVEKTRSELQATVDPNGTFKTPEEAKESIVDYLNNNGGGRAGLNDLAEKLGLKKKGDEAWRFHRPNMRLIADAVVKGWEFPEAFSGSEDDEEEEEDIMGYGGDW